MCHTFLAEPFCRLFATTTSRDLEVPKLLMEASVYSRPIPKTKSEREGEVAAVHRPIDWQDPTTATVAETCGQRFYLQTRNYSVY